MWKPIVAAVDGSEAARHAARWAWDLTRATGADYRLIHALKSEWIDPGAPLPPTSEMERVFYEVGVRKIRDALAESLSEEMLAHLEIRPGRPAWVIEQFASEVDAGLLVIGGKHHSALERWLGGSTAHHLARKIDVPLIVTADQPGEVRRILVALDLSHAAVPTVAWANTMATQFGATVRVLHVVEPPPTMPEIPVALRVPDLEAEAGQYLEQHVWPHVPGDIERAVKSGPARVVVADEVASFGADLLVVGSHGRGWVDRLLLGSFTEWLLNNLPTSVGVVPVASP